jgi:hypothetical protein
MVFITGMGVEAVFKDAVGSKLGEFCSTGFLFGKKFAVGRGVG